MELWKLRRLLQTKQTGISEWSNPDLDPSPPNHRRWSAWYFFAFQFSIALSPTTYNLGASLVAIGLNWWTIVVASFVGTILCALVLFFNSRGGSIYHVGFPVYARICAGFYGSLFFMFIRGVVAILYMGTQSYYASCMMAVALRCVFGHNWTDIENRLPESAGITSQGLLAFFIYWAMQLPFAWIHPSRAGPVFAVKSWILPPCYIATMIWAMYKAKGFHFATIRTTEASGAALGWSFMKAINSVVSGVVPPLINIPDLARYANRPRDIWPMAAGLLVSKPIIILIGMVTTSAGASLFGEAYWNLWDFNSAVLDHHWSSTSRTLIFFSSIAQVYATLATNIASNSIPVGCDLSGLFPSYFTIRRGQILCSILAILVVPWKIVNSASSFLTFLGSYLCFICPIVACMMVDYWIARRGNVHVPSLYRCEPTSPYYYCKGFNLRAYVSWAIGIILVISGVSGVLHPGSVSEAAVHMYNMSFLLSTTAAGLSYFTLCKIWPVRIYPYGRREEPVEWEHMRSFEGYFVDELKPEYLRDQGILGAEEEPQPQRFSILAVSEKNSLNRFSW